jgi:hypothetical protein
MIRLMISADKPEELGKLVQVMGLAMEDPTLHPMLIELRASEEQKVEEKNDFSTDLRGLLGLENDC